MELRRVKDLQRREVFARHEHAVEVEGTWVCHNQVPHTGRQLLNRKLLWHDDGEVGERLVLTQHRKQDFGDRKLFVSDLDFSRVPECLPARVAVHILQNLWLY